MEGGCSEKKKVDVKGKSLIDLIFSWSLKDIFNEELYKDQVGKIPESFQSAQHYLEAYVFPLLEETRAELSSCMNVLSTSPFAEIVSVEESKPLGSFSYNIRINSWRNEVYNRSKEPYRTLPGDIFVISDVKHSTFLDLEPSERTWTLAWVPKITEKGSSLNLDDSIPTFLKCKAAKDIGVKDGLQKPLYVVFLMNITTNNRIWNSLHLNGNANIIKEVLCHNSMVEEICSQCCLKSNAIFAERLHSELSHVLNESQRAAVVCSICRMHCNHKSYVELVWGPPGTGKTKTISMLLWYALGMNYRILACAPTNVAITELASRVVKQVKDSFKVNSRGASFLCPLGDLLLFGNKERMKVGSDLEDIYLDYRVDRLLECFGQLTGWKQCFSLMIEFFVGCVSQYHAFLENNICKKNNQSFKGEKAFAEFARERFKCTALPLRRCVQIFCTHAPKSFILEHNFQNMVFLIELLDSFGSLLFQDDVLSTELEALFSLPELVENSPYSFVCTLTLSDLRKQCLRVLRILQNSLDQLKLPSFRNKDSIRKYCVQRASLIFCTASSSYKLRSWLNEPLNLLVIDEAAQLKECESTIALQLPGIRHAILIGDECQLPATVKSKVSDRAGFGRSLFERLSLMGHSKHLLNIQYRMQPSISCFPNSKFYLNRILDAPNVKDRSYVQRYLPGPMFGPYSFLSVSGGREQLDNVGRSLKNLVEVALVTKIVQNLYKVCSGSKQKISIGIVSPYAAQVMAIQEKLGCKYDNLDGFKVKVKSIDGFQGGEEDIIIVSTVRSNSSGSVGFISNLQRTNVALTRARHCLWILGNGTTLANSGSIWEAVVHDAKIRQCFFCADEDKDLAKAILDVKEELFELDDLLCQESVLFKTCRWKVLISEKFARSLKELKSSQTKKLVIFFLLKLSTGWRPAERNGCFIGEVSSQILYQFRVEGLHIIWTIDIEKDSKYIQVLKVWDILPLENVSRMIKCLDIIFRTYTGDFLNYCKAKCLEGDLEIPMTWICSSDLVKCKNPREIEPDGDSISVAVDGTTYLGHSKAKENLLLVKFYSLSYRLVDHLLSGRDSGILDFLDHLTDQELEIILSPRSTFVVGRPSSRKLTVLATRLFQKERQHIASEGYYDKNSNTIMDISLKNEVCESIEKTKEAVLRQIFITVTPKRCAAIKQYLSNLKSFTYSAKFSAESKLIDLHDMVDLAHSMDTPDSLLNIPAKTYPLVITFQKLLVMLDRTVRDSYFERFHAVKEHSHARIKNSRSFALNFFIRTKEVSYDRFSLSYWPCFNSQLTEKLDSSTVFTEIIFHIKGGLPAGAACGGKLSREDYVQLSRGHRSALSRKKREKIYNIFVDYEKKKVENGEFDWADLVIDLHRRLENNTYEGDKMDFMYIDEVQYLSKKEITLLKYICRNVYEGIVFSADMAQTIANRTGFTLRDSQSLFYSEFILGSRNSGSDGRTKDGEISDIFHLSQNVHAHAGVLKIAQSVIDLLFRFFPLSVDILCPETVDCSLINFELPVLLQPGKDENAIITIFGNSGIVGKSDVNFGAEQVILVRDDCARKEIASLVGKRSLVLTIMECQGLEFQDVLLYKFFESSPFKSQWRIIYEYMKEQDMLDSVSSKSFLSSNQAKHDGLCFELKLLYLAITRSRQRLWICENVKELSNPMFDYWMKQCLIQIRQVDNSLLQSMQVGSSKEQWRSRGIELYCESRIEMAMMCFRRAGDIYMENWAKAASLRTAADQMHCSNPEMAHTVFSEAAEIYSTLGRDELAAQCFIESKEYRIAGAIYMNKFGDSRLEDVGDCFSLAGFYELAAEAYARGNYFAKCLSICTSRNLYNMGLQFIQSWRQHVIPDAGIVKISQDMKMIEHDFLEKCALHYHELEDKKTMLEFVKSFNSMDSKRFFLKNLNCFDELLLLEKESGNFMEAAAIAKMKGDLLLEVDLLEKAGNYKDASLLIIVYVFANSCWASGNKGWPFKPFRGKEKLLTKAKLLAGKDSNVFYEFVYTEANVLSNQASSFSEMKQYLIDSERQQNLGGIILSARKILDAHLLSLISMYEWEHGLVMDLLKFSEGRISQNRVSIETLIYFWNFWKEKIVNIIEYLECLNSQDVNENMKLGGFCLNYFGVRKLFNKDDTLYLLLISDAEWAVGIDDRLLQRKGEFVCVEVSQFVSAAKTYWCSEILSVSMKVLGTLKALNEFSVKTSLPKSCQSKTAVNIFKITHFLTECEFLESCIDDETLQKVFDMGLESILFLENVTVDPDVVDSSQEIGRITHGFLVKCALHYHALEDKRTMIKFVRAFHSIESRRSFLKTLQCFDELLLLEEESGNFMEAAAIANLKGYLLLEVDLLAKAGHYKDASMLILFYVFSNSLWASGSKGWPLKPFKRKEKFLTKAKAFAQKDSYIFYEFVCIEANILSNQASNLFEIKQNLDASHTQMNLRGVILSAWKILDAHFRLKVSNYEWEDELVTDLGRHSEDMISQNRASFETLVYSWGFWKDKIFDIFYYLRSLEAQDVNENTSCEEFCLSYMGVRKKFIIPNTVYSLLNSDAEWVRKMNDGSLQSSGEFVSIDCIQFVSAARRYWCSEVLTIGFKLLKVLEALHMFSVRNNLSIFCQSMTALRFFEVSNFLLESEFLESSSDNTLQEIFNLRSQFIKYCIRHAPDVLMVKRNQGIYESEHVFLEKCALLYHKLQDNRMMMTFIKAFGSVDSKRTFLRTLNCFDELLLMEEELGNFIEAASIARQKRDLLLEVDLLQKARHFKDAAILILSYVLANSLWAPESKGWPLKQFVQKDDLLIKSKSFAYNESNVFYEFVCTEVDILVDRESILSEMKEYFSAAQRNNSLIGEILSARKILDAHFNSSTPDYEWEDELIIDLRKHSEDRISKNLVSIETLIYFWNFWREMVVNVFKYLRRLEAQDITGYTSYEMLCLSYLGVRKQCDEQNTVYLLLNAGADWVRRIDDGSFNLVSLDAQQFVAAARSYWSSEVFSVGLKVLESLSALHTFSLWNSFSLFRQSTTLIHIFDITKFLMESDFLERFSGDRILRSFFELSTRHLFENVFPLDWCNTLTENMMILRGTKLFKNVLKEIIFENINSESELTYGKIGRVVMIMFGSGKLSAALYEMVSERFDVNPPWKAFIHKLKGYVMGSEFTDGSMTEKIDGSPGEGSLVFKLHDVLSDTFNIDWRQELDYISPNCFLYLVERFLFLVSYDQECLFTTKSSFIEWLICHELDTSQTTRSVADIKSSATGAFDFVAHIVHQLLMNKYNTMEWIKRSNMKLTYYQHLVLRLVVVICLLCLNSGKYFDVLQNIISRIDISSELPLVFSEALRGGSKCKLFNVLAKALAKVENPLVIVILEDNGQKFSCPEAISINRKDLQCGQGLLRELFRENVNNDAQDHDCSVEAKTSKSCGVGFTSSSNDEENSEELGEDGNMKICASYAPKANLDKKIKFTSAAMIQSFCKSPSNGNDGNSSEKVNSMSDELKKSIALGISDGELENNIPTVSEAHPGLHLGRPKVEPILNGLIVQNDGKTVSEASPTSVTSVVPRKKMKDANSKAKENCNSEHGKIKASVQKPLLVWKPKAT